MEVNIVKHDNEVVAKLIGRLDTLASAEVSKALEPLKEVADKKIVLDCSEMSYISSSGLRIFLGLRKEAGAKGGTVVVRSINEDIRKVFMMTGFLNLFEIE